MSLIDDINEAHLKYRNKAYKEAEIAVRQLLHGHPDNSDILRLGALTALSLNQVVTAHQRLSQACLTCDMTAEISNSFGNILTASGEWAQAEEAYKRAMTLDAHYEPVRGNLIDLYVKSGQADRALSEIEVQAKAYGMTELMRLAQAVALADLGRYEEALGLTDELALNDETAYLKTRLLFHLGRYDEMKVSASQIPAKSEYAAQALALLTNAYAMNNEWDGFHEAIYKAVHEAEATPPVFVKSIQNLRRSGFNTIAEDVRESANDRFENDADIMAETANSLVLKGDYNAAIIEFQKALSLRPGHLPIMLDFAQACLSAKQYDMCQSLIQGALQQTPNNQFLYALLVTLFRLQGQAYEPFYDYENFVRSYDLDPPVGYKTIAAFNHDLKRSLERYHSFEAAPLNQSLRGGTQTDTDLFWIEDPVVKQFFQMIDAPIKAYMEHIGQDASHPFMRRNTGRYRMKGAWSVKLSPDGHHVNHVHPMGWISSSYYVDVPIAVNNETTKEGWIKFGEPGIEGVDLPAEKFIKPQGGRLVLFPSYMWHGTIPFSGETSRLTLPFDVVPA